MAEDWTEGLGPDDPVTEDSVAREFALQQQGWLCYCAARATWYVYDGAVYRPDRTGVALHRARKVARAVGTQQDGTRRHGSGTPRFVAGVERFARSDPAFAMTPEDFDVDPFTLGTPGGPVDLRSGVQQAPDPGQNLSRATAVAPAQTADCPLWRRVLDDTFGDPEIIGFLQRFLGCALTGDTREPMLLFGHGPSGTGKSVVSRTIAGLMGDYAASAPGLLSAGRRPAGDLGNFDGLRLVTATDTGGAFDATRLAALTGGDPVTVRRPLRDATTFTPRCKLLVMGTAPPALGRVDEAMRRRLCLLPFRNRPAAPDHALTEALRAEWPGILRWMIEGCRDWQAQGLRIPRRLRETTADHVGTEDVLGQFLDESCECGEAAWTAPSGALYEAWSAYARTAGECAGSQREFAGALQARGFARGRTFKGRHFSGLRLRLPAGEGGDEGGAAPTTVSRRP